MRSTQIQFRSQFLTGFILGLILVVIKLIFFLPIDIADAFYGAGLLVTIIITIAEMLKFPYLTLEPHIRDFIIGFLLPLDFYAVLILFGLPLKN